MDGIRLMPCRFLKEYKNIYFFGDKTDKNDEIYVCDETVGYSVISGYYLNEKFLN